jgi:hypothetical protein
MAFLVAIPIAVVASDAFTDVPESNVHHADIAWLKDARVTIGCNPPANSEFCPGDPVLREQMASFMRRLAENRVVDAASALEATHAEQASNADLLDGLDSYDYLPNCSPGYMMATAWIDVRLVSDTEFSTDGVYDPYTCNGEDLLVKRGGPYRLQVVVDDGGDDVTIGSNDVSFGILTTNDPIFSIGSQILQCSPAIPPTILCMNFDFFGHDGTAAFPNDLVFLVVYGRQ